MGGLLVAIVAPDVVGEGPVAVDRSLEHSAFLMIRIVLVMVCASRLLKGSERFSPYKIPRFARDVFGQMMRLIMRSELVIVNVLRFCRVALNWAN